jgi:hypothetical protein
MFHAGVEEAGRRMEDPPFEVRDMGVWLHMDDRVGAKLMESLLAREGKA